MIEIGVRNSCEASAMKLRWVDRSAAKAVEHDVERTGELLEFHGRRHRQPRVQGRRRNRLRLRSHRDQRPQPMPSKPQASLWCEKGQYRR